MVFFQYDARILPEITLIGKDTRTIPHQNIRRLSEDYIYYVVTKGEMYFSEDGVDHHLAAGDCFLFEPGKLHFGTALSEYQIAYIHFRHPAVTQVDVADSTYNELTFEGLVTLPKVMHIADTAGFRSVLTIVERAIERDCVQFENSSLLCACAVQEAFLEIGHLFGYTTLRGHTDKVQSISRIREVIAYLNENYRKRLTGDILEKELSYNFDYLNQLFRRYLDTTIFQMLEDLRIKKARNLIISSDLSMERIAVEVGYKDETYFSKVFKKHTGLSPRQFRKTTNAPPE